MTLINTAAAADMVASPPADLVIVDVRTPEEFGEGHLLGAIQIDFYDDDFPAQLANLDTSVPYLIYCRSGARSAKTAELMGSLGFATVYDVEGGMIAWTGEGRPTVTS